MSASKNLLLALTVFCFLASACTPNRTMLPVTLVAAPSATQTPQPIPTLTLTQPPTILPATPTPAHTQTVTPLPTIPTFTPTFDARTIVTVTPAPKAECPKEDPSLVADFKIPDLSNNCTNQDDCFPKGTGDEILNFLNKGGPVSSVISRLKTASGKNFERTVLYKDITGDTVPDLTFFDFGLYAKLYILKCENKAFKALSPKIEPGGVIIYSAEDLNLNGIPEIILTYKDCSGSGCFGVYTFEWNGQDFTDLSPEAGIWGLQKFAIQDMDHNGTKELILKGDYPGSGVYSLYVPWRLRTDTYGWDGKNFTLVSAKYDPPEYRFQALQDADSYVQNTNFSEALVLYQDAIFSNKLEWWSAERRKYLVDTYYESYRETPQAFPTPIIDSTEYPRLAAYAYYRMVILHIHLGHMDAAATQYATLQEKFPAASPGHPYVEMASAFWEAYQASQNMTTACGAAIEYAAEHPDILTVLGSDYHGSQSHTYVPTDVCPFR